MYCPKCGQQQISDNTKFCSRCGLLISGLADWLAGDAVLTKREEEARVPLPSPRRKRTRRGAKLIFLSGALVPISLLLSLLVGEPIPMFIPLALFFVGLVLMLYSRIFAEEVTPAKSRQARPRTPGSVPEGTALPPAANIWTNSVGGQRVRTTELVQPSSVTEGTTKLLNSD